MQKVIEIHWKSFIGQNCGAEVGNSEKLFKLKNNFNLERLSHTCR